MISSAGALFPARVASVKVLISGAGIAGPTLAYWLLRHGLEPTLLEKAERLRTAGYVIDFWGAGFDVAERMGLLSAVRRQGYRVREVRMVGRDGRRVGGFCSEVFSRLTSDRFVSLPRGDLAALIYGALEGRVETLFGETVTSLQEDGSGVRVSFLRAPARTVDVVVGADGLHSEVRRLVFGPQTQFERYLGYQVAAFEVSGYPHRDPDIYMMYTQVGGQVARFTMRENRTLFLFVFAEPDPRAGGDTEEGQKALLRQRFGSGGWECAEILGAMDRADNFYFDRVSQIRMPRWSQGRVGLLGDAAFCVSLLAGQGSALAMVAAYVLAGELNAARGDPRQAFARYQDRLGALIARKQEAAARFGGFFAPTSRLGLFLRNRLSGLLNVPLLARLTVGREMRDELALPDY
jgi:2-polyprenyl-6-methoxyphenol hydroxylase-like FAD-dependent oxidoreductase